MPIVLVVDDNALNIRLVQATLQSQGYTVLAAGSVPEAEDLLRQSLPDLILLDVQLPGVDGLTFARQLKAAPDRQEIPIIAVTALAMPGDEARAREAGCDGYISKPFRPDTLIERVRDTLNAGL